MSISLTRILQQITGLNTFFAGPSASRDNGVVLLDTATVTWGTDGQGNIQATASGSSLPTASAAGQLPTSTGAGTNYTAQNPTFALIQKQTIASPVAAVTFSSIPQTYTHLKLVWSGISASNAGDFALLQANGVTSGYIAQAMFQTTGNSSPGVGAGGFSQTGIIVGADIGEATLQNYTSTVSAQGAGYVDGGNFISGAGFSGTQAAVTSFSLSFLNGTNWTSGVFSLYGMA